MKNNVYKQNLSLHQNSSKEKGNTNFKNKNQFYKDSKSDLTVVRAVLEKFNGKIISPQNQTIISFHCRRRDLNPHGVAPGGF